MSYRWVSHALLSGACAIALAGPAYAAAAATAAADAAAVDAAAADANDDSVIVVTAQNRKQDVNDVPIAFDVISGDQLKTIGFFDLNDNR
ncbi:MAG: hypothetical protein H7315_10060 [Herminiimonas sp.]|nr:hypothetical protein [Herminiimonas sp.]